MFKGDYNFFDYKYNIEGYSGQDYGGLAQWVYLGVSAVLLVVLLMTLRRMPREKIIGMVGRIGIFLAVFYLIKVTWETVHDVKRGDGFNLYLLPMDTCSLITPAALLAGFNKGKIGQAARCWIVTGGILGGFGTMLFLTAFRYYPFCTYGAFYSMIWHFTMVFLGLMLIVAYSGRMDFSIVTRGFLFQLAFSAIIIPFDYIMDMDFMFYRELSFISLTEDLGGWMTERGLWFMNPIIMMAMYFASFTIIWAISAGIKNHAVRRAEA